MRRTILRLVAGVAVVYACVTLAGDWLRFSGTDDQASAAIAESQPGYRRWITPAWAPGSRTAEVLLFGLQALIGASVLGWALAGLRGHGEPDAPDAQDPRDAGRSGG